MKTKPTLINRRTAFTLVEVIVMIVIIALLALFYLPTVTTHSHVPARRINCMNNLKQIGTAYRLWANDNGDVWPSQQTVASHGWADYLTNANLGPMCWTNYAIMADDLGLMLVRRKTGRIEFHQPIQQLERLLLCRCERK